MFLSSIPTVLTWCLQLSVRQQSGEQPVSQTVKISALVGTGLVAKFHSVTRGVCTKALAACIKMGIVEPCVKVVLYEQVFANPCRVYKSIDDRDRCANNIATHNCSKTLRTISKFVQTVCRELRF